MGFQSDCADVRDLAQHCRAEARELDRLATTLPWAGFAGQACTAALRLHSQRLEALADNYELLADALWLHDKACVAARLLEASLGVVGSVAGSAIKAVT